MYLTQANFSVMFSNANFQMGHTNRLHSFSGTILLLVKY